MKNEIKIHIDDIEENNKIIKKEILKTSNYLLNTIISGLSLAPISVKV